IFLWLKPGWPRSARFLAICSRVTPSEIHSQTRWRMAGGRWAPFPRGSRLVEGLRKSSLLRWEDGSAFRRWEDGRIGGSEDMGGDPDGSVCAWMSDGIVGLLDFWMGGGGSGSADGC